MIIITVVAVYVLGMLFAPRLTRAVFNALKSLMSTLAVIGLVVWRIFPGSGGVVRRF
jgi:hypothetical protein